MRFEKKKKHTTLHGLRVTHSNIFSYNIVLRFKQKSKSNIKHLGLFIDLMLFEELNDDIHVLPDCMFPMVEVTLNPLSVRPVFFRY